jgi:hypothetical protein
MRDLPNGVNLGAGERLALWIDVHVPRKTLAGDYRGRMYIRTEGRQDAVVNLALKVYDFVLPDERPLVAVGGFDYRTLFGTFLSRDGHPFVPEVLDRNNPQVMKGLVLLRQMMVMAHEHRLDLFDRQMHPLVRRDMSGKVLLDWSDYDAVVLPYLNGTAFDDRVGVGAWPMPFGDNWPDPRNYGGIGTDEYASTALAVLAECQQHLSKNLGLGQQLFLWPYRGAVDQNTYADSLRLFRLARLVKLARYSDSLDLIVRVITKQREFLLITFTIQMVLLLISSAIMFFLEHEAQPEKFPNIFGALAWGLNAMTSGVGYSDISPVTPLGKAAGAILAFIEIVAMALPIGVITAGIEQEMNITREKEENTRRGETRKKYMAAYRGSVERRYK